MTTYSPGQSDFLSPIRQQFDYYIPAGSTKDQMRYFGTGPQGAANSDTAWTVKRLTWSNLADGTDHVVDVQTLNNVAWGANTAARDALGWAS